MMDDPSTHEQIINLGYYIPGAPKNTTFKGTIFVNRKRCPCGYLLSGSYINAITATVINPSQGESVKRPLSY